MNSLFQDIFSTFDLSTASILPVTDTSGWVAEAPHTKGSNFPYFALDGMKQSGEFFQSMDRGVPYLQVILGDSIQS